MAQVPTDAKSNKITAIPQVSELIDVRGSVITIDAMSAQVGIVRAIPELGGDVVVCLQGNQGNLHKSVSEFGEKQADHNFEGCVHETLHESARKETARKAGSRTFIKFEIPKDFPVKEKCICLKIVGIVVR